jgi:two-component system, OmpR family, KDP operon response regulator KdpE
MSPRILVIDDEPALCRTLERALRSLQYEVVSTGDPHLVYTMLDEVDVDLVLLDLHLQQISGDALFLALVRRWPRLRGRVVLMTGDTFAEKDHWPRELVSCPTLLKPFTLETLGNAVRAALAAAEVGTRANGHA